MWKSSSCLLWYSLCNILLVFVKSDFFSAVILTYGFKYIYDQHKSSTFFLRLVLLILLFFFFLVRIMLDSFLCSLSLTSCSSLFLNVTQCLIHECILHFEIIFHLTWGFIKDLTKAEKCKWFFQPILCNDQRHIRGWSSRSLMQCFLVFLYFTILIY